MYQLRDYQQELIDKIFSAWAEGNRRVMAQLATGGGKTVILAYIARTFLEQGQGVLVVAHRKELILQAKQKLEEICGLECGIIKAGYPAEYHKDVQVASIQSLNRRKFRPNIGLLVYDESHHCSSKTYSDLMERYPDAYILGVTATPCRTDGQGFKWLFDRLVTGISTRELIKLGHLCKFKLFGGKPISTKGLKTSNGDFDQAQLEDRAMALIGDVVPTWEKYSRGKQTIVFAVSVAHSKGIVELFNKAGVISEHVDGSTPDLERAAIIERFRTRQTTVLSNVGIFTEGFDLPAIETVQCVRPTMSLSLWLQMCGRGLRPSPGKEHCIIIDHSDNWRSHGLPDEDREWSLDPVSLRPTKFTQECEECRHIFTPLSHEQTKPISKYLDKEGALWTVHNAICPNCRHSFEYEQGVGGAGGFRVATKGYGDVLEVSLDCTQVGLNTFTQLIAEQEASGKAKGWIYYRALQNPEVRNFTLGDWRFLAEYLGYKQGWAYKAFSEATAVQQSA
ncbi:MAG: DEAD/DEAH box helicase [Rhizonema sp. PD38]|nr:DEAD/DEAH box helicase [Rhizonema sp. PD38]